MKTRVSLFKYLTTITITLLVAFIIAFLSLYIVGEYNNFSDAREKIQKESLEQIKINLKKDVHHFANHIQVERKLFIQEYKKDIKSRTELLGKLLEIAYKNHNSFDGALFKLIDTQRLEAEQISLYDSGTKNLLYISGALPKPIKSYCQEYTFKAGAFNLQLCVAQEDIEKNAQRQIIEKTELLQKKEDKTKYFFIGNWEGVSQTYPAKGKNMLKVQDKNGIFIVKELIKKAKNGGGFVSYVMPPLKEGLKNTEKISYTEPIEIWEWYVGAGLLLEDIDKQVQLLESKMFAKMLQTILLTFCIAIVVLGAFFLLIGRTQKRARKDFNLFKGFLERLVESNEPIDKNMIRYKEFEDIANHANTMLEKKVLLERRLELYRLIVNTVGDFMAMVDKEHRYLAVNETYAKFFGKSREEIEGKTAEELFGRDVFERSIKNQNERALSGESFTKDFYVKDTEGKKHVFQASYFPYYDDNEEAPQAFAIYARDITEQQKAKEQLEFLAQHDILTKLPNRLLLNDRIDQAIKSAKRNVTSFSICFIDLDNFKKINDSYGHSYGDEVLKQVANRISGSIRSVDTLSRIGGDEFVLLLEDIESEERVLKIISKIQEVLKQVFIVKHKKFFITASIGICIYPNDGANAEELLKNADIAMYEAKELGKNSFTFFTKQMSIDSFHQVSIEEELKEAINKEQFALYYQPQVNLSSGELIGLEALIRWKHPTKGILSPDMFISFAESTRMIVAIGEFVLKRACEDMLRLQRLYNYRGKISINVSGIQIEFSDFFEKLSSVLKETQVNPKRIELELTESVFMSDPERWIKLLERIKKTGVQIAIDDFGTGYSSLSYLKELPIDKLKIDMSFVKDIPNDQGASSIVHSIIDLAKNLNLTTLAEGIESPEQEDFLKTSGCIEGQGYLYSKAVDFDTLTKWIGKEN